MNRQTTEVAGRTFFGQPGKVIKQGKAIKPKPIYEIDTFKHDLLKLPTNPQEMAILHKFAC